MATKKPAKRNLTKKERLEEVQQSIHALPQILQSGNIIYGENFSFPLKKLSDIAQKALLLTQTLGLSELESSLKFTLEQISYRQKESQSQIILSLIWALNLGQTISKAMVKNLDDLSPEQKNNLFTDDLKPALTRLDQELRDCWNFLQSSGLQQIKELSKRLVSIHSTTLTIGRQLVEKPSQESNLYLLFGHMILALLEIVPFFTVERKIAQSESALIIEVSFGEDSFALKILTPPISNFGKDLRQAKHFIKQLDQKFHDEEEAAHLNHDNIVIKYHFFHHIYLSTPQEEARLFLLPTYSMELLQLNLVDYIQLGKQKHQVQSVWEDPPLLQNIFRYLFFAAQGLEFVHSQKQTHKNLKPGNIFLSKNTVVLADFGVSPSVPNALSKYNKDTAPEVVKHKVYSPQSDVYAFGVVLLRIFFGEHAERTPFSQLQQQCRYFKQPLNQVGFTILEFASHLCHSKPEKRLSMEQVKVSLRKIALFMDNPVQMAHIRETFQPPNSTEYKKKSSDSSPRKAYWVWLAAASFPVLFVAFISYAIYLIMTLPISPAEETTQTTKPLKENKERIVIYQPPTNVFGMDDKVTHQKMVLLSSKSTSAAEKASEKLKREGIKIIPSLIDYLPNLDILGKRHAADIMVTIGPKAEKLFLRALQEKQEKTRIGVAETLGYLRSPENTVLRALIRALSDESKQVRAKAAASLGQIGESNKELIQALIDSYTQEETHEVKNHIAIALARLGAENEAAVPALIHALSTEDPSIKYSAAAALEKLSIPTPNIPDLIKAIQYAELTARELLLRIGERAIPMLVLALKSDPEVKVREKIAVVLGKMDITSKPLVLSLAQALEDEDVQVRRNAARALGEVGPMGILAISSLAKALSDPDTGVRYNSILALGEMGSQSEGALVSLAKVLKDKEQHIRISTVNTLMKIGEKAIPALIFALRNKDSEVRYSAANALGSLGKRARSAEKALSRALQDSNLNVRDAASDALKNIRQN